MTRLEPLNSIGNFYAKAGPSPDRPRPLRLAMAKGVLTILVAICAALASLRVVQQCFLALTSTPLTTSHGRVVKVGDADIAEGDFAGGALFAGPDIPSLEGGREVNVAMFNKKRTKRDRSEGWTKRKKFRSCSLLARAATKSGRK
ncbi:unnamed protein product, partial [Durusdinium trenchii]